MVFKCTATVFRYRISSTCHSFQTAHMHVVDITEYTYSLTYMCSTHRSLTKNNKVRETMLTTWFRKMPKLAEKLSRRVLMNPSAERTTSRAFDAMSKHALSISTLSSSSSTLSATLLYNITYPLVI